MDRRRRLASWLAVLVGGVAFVAGLSAQEGVRALSQAVVTPESPIWANAVQDPDTPAPQEAPAPAPAAQGGGRGGRRRQSAACLQPGHHRHGQDRRRHLQGASDRRSALLRDSEGAAWQGLPLGHADQEERTIGAGYGGQAAGNRVVRWDLPRRPRPAETHRLQRHCRSLEAHRPGRRPTPTIPTIIRAFNVAAFSPAGDPVIDVTQLFMTDVAEFSVRGRVGGRGLTALEHSSRRSSRFRRTSTSK